MFLAILVTMILIYLILKLVFKKDKWASIFEWDLILGDIKASIN